MNKFLNFRYVGYQIMKNRRLMILLAVVLSIFYPLALLMNGNYFFAADMDSNYFQSVANGFKIANLVIFLIISAYLPLLIFKYMTSRKDLDVYEALPIKSENLFLSNFLATMIIVIIPQIVAWVFGFFVQLNYGLQPNVLTMLGEIGVMFVYLPIIMFPAMIAINNIGTLFDSFIYTSILQVLPFIAILVVQMYGSAYIFADNSILTPQVWSAITYHYSFVNSVLLIGSSNTFYWGYVIWPVVGFILIAANRYLYRIRPVENVEQPRINKWFTTILVFILTILMLLIALYSYNSYYSQRAIDFIYPILSVLVMYLVLDAITHRGFSHFFKAIIEFAVLLAIAIGVLFGMRSTNGFGFDYIIPDNDEIEKVVVSSYQRLTFQNRDKYNEPNYQIAQNYHQYYAEIIVEDDIEHVTDFHEYIVETYYDYFTQKSRYEQEILGWWSPGMAEGSHPYHTEYVSEYEKNGLESDIILLYSDQEYYDKYKLLNVRLDYYLKDGDHFYRSYTVPLDWSYDLYQMTQ